MSQNYSNTRKFRGFITSGYYTDEEYRAFTKQVFIKLDEYFIEDCTFVIGIGGGIRVKVVVTTSERGNQYQITYDDDILEFQGQSQAEFEHTVFMDMLKSLQGDINYLKENVNKIIDAARTGTPLERKDDSDDNNNEDDD